MKRLRVHCIACPVLIAELQLLAPSAKTTVTITPLEMALHQKAPGELRAALQKAIDHTSPENFDAIALGYGLCNRGIVGLQARALPVVIPRAHDCIGMLLGNANYLAQLQSQPGTYFQTAGWLENRPPGGDLLQSAPGAEVFSLSQEQLIKRYGLENTQYLLEQLAGFTRNYQRMAFISTPVPNTQQKERESRKIAREKGWSFEKLSSDLNWLKRLIDADWNEREFLTVRPGNSVDACYDSSLVKELCTVNNT